jgi:hypothetical protein
MPKSFDNHPWTVNFDKIIDWIFYLDIFINFRTQFIDPKNDEFVSDSKQIALNYLKGRLIIDILASLPFELIASIFEGKMERSTSNLLSLLKLTRLLRLGRMISYFQVNQNFKFGMKML